MNNAKSVFFSLYMMAAMAIAVYAARSLWISHDHIIWGGAILVIAQSNKAEKQ